MSAVNKTMLLNAIEAKRTELLDVAFEEGLTSSEAIKHSQELDRLLNLYDQLYNQAFLKTKAK